MHRAAARALPRPGRSRVCRPGPGAAAEAAAAPLTAHGVRLAGTCLPIGQHGAIVAIQGGVQQLGDAAQAQHVLQRPGWKSVQQRLSGSGCCAAGGVRRRGVMQRTGSTFCRKGWQAGDGRWRGAGQAQVWVGGQAGGRAGGKAGRQAGRHHRRGRSAGQGATLRTCWREAGCRQAWKVKFRVTAWLLRE